MNRRTFLASAMASVASLAIDPEKLLWEPGKKTIFIPKPKELQLMKWRFVMAGEWSSDEDGWVFHPIQFNPDRHFIAECVDFGGQRSAWLGNLRAEAR